MNKRRLVSILLTLCMVVNMFPVTAFARTTDAVTNNLETTAESGERVITGFKPLAKTEYELAIGTKEADVKAALDLPKTVTALVGGNEKEVRVEWVNERKLKLSEPCEVTFAAEVLDKGYIFNYGVAMPKVTVRVTNIPVKAVKPLEKPIEKEEPKPQVQTLGAVPYAAPANGGDVSTTGLDLYNAPAAITQYKAGAGTITFDPTVTPKTVTLNNAEINVPSNAGIFDSYGGAACGICLPDEKIKVVLAPGTTNKIVTNNEYGACIYSPRDVIISGAGILEAKSLSAAGSGVLYSRNLTISDKASVTVKRSDESKRAVHVSDVLTIDGASLNSVGDIHWQGNYPLNVRNNGTIISKGKIDSRAGYDTDVRSGGKIINTDENNVNIKGTVTDTELTLSEATTLNVGKNTVLTVTDLNNIKGKIVNSGEIYFPEGTDLKGINIEGTGKTYIGGVNKAKYDFAIVKNPADKISVTNITGVDTNKVSAETDVTFKVSVIAPYVVEAVKYKVGTGSENELIASVEGIYTIPKEKITGNVTVTINAKDPTAAPVIDNTGLDLSAGLVNGTYKAGTGTVTVDADTNTITLDNATINVTEGIENDDEISALRLPSGVNIELKIIGNNKLTGEWGIGGEFATAVLKITGTAEDTLICEGNNGYGIFYGGKVIVDGPKEVKCTGTFTGFSAGNGAEINSNLTAIADMYIGMSAHGTAPTIKVTGENTKVFVQGPVCMEIENNLVSDGATVITKGILQAHSDDPISVINNGAYVNYEDEESVMIMGNITTTDLELEGRTNLTVSAGAEVTIKDGDLPKVQAIETIHNDGIIIIETDDINNIALVYSLGIDSGTGKVILKDISGNKKEYTIDYKTLPTANVLTYNFNDQELLTAGVANTGYKVKYKLGEAGTWQDTVPTGKNAGDYNLYFKTVKVGNESTETATIGPVKVNIAVKKVTKPVAKATTASYAGKEQAFSIISTEYYTVSNNVHKEVGKYKVNIALKDKTNTCWEDGSVGDLINDFEITRAYVRSVAQITTPHKTYDGNDKYAEKITFNVPGANGEGAVAVFPSGKFSSTEAGTGLTLTPVGEPEFTFINGFDPAHYDIFYPVIEKAYIDPQDIPLEFGGKAVYTYGETPGFTSPDSRFTLRYLGREGTSYNSATPPTNAGKYKVTAISSNSNYISSSTFDFEILQLTGSISVKGLGRTYDGTEKALIELVSSSTGTPYYNVNDGTWGTEIPKATDAKTYKVGYKLVGDANHAGTAEQYINVEIKHKQIAEPAEITTAVTYDGTVKTYEVTSTADYTVTGGTQTDANAEGHTVTIALKDKDNTVWKTANNANDLTYKFKINPKEVTVTAAVKNKVYDGNNTAEITSATLSANYDGENLKVVNGTATFDNKNVGTDKTVTFAGFTLDGTKAANYKLTAQPASVTADITALDTTISGITAANRDYNAETAVTISGGTVDALIADDVVTVDLTNAQADMADKNVGTGKSVTVTGLALSGADAGNYHITTCNIPTVDIAKIDLGYDVSGLVLNKQYNGTNKMIATGLKLTGAMEADNDGVQLVLPVANAVFADEKIGNNKDVVVTLDGTVTGPAAINYNLPDANAVFNLKGNITEVTGPEIMHNDDIKKRVVEVNLREALTTAPYETLANNRKFDSPEKIENILRKELGVGTSTSEMHDYQYQEYSDAAGMWIYKPDVTTDFIIPYPEKTNERYRFKVAHMKLDGTVEVISDSNIIKDKNGLIFENVTTSPFLISWKSPPRRDHNIEPEKPDTKPIIPEEKLPETAEPVVPTAPEEKLPEITEPEASEKPEESEKESSEEVKPENPKDHYGDGGEADTESEEQGGGIGWIFPWLLLLIIIIILIIIFRRKKDEDEEEEK